MMVLRGWVLYVIVDYIYAVKVVCEYVCVGLSGLYGFDSDEYSVQLCSKDILVS